MKYRILSEVVFDDARGAQGFTELEAVHIVKIEKEREDNGEFSPIAPLDLQNDASEEWEKSEHDQIRDEAIEDGEIDSEEDENQKETTVDQEVADQEPMDGDKPEQPVE